MLPNPLALIAEVTHRCPLRCVYCSNPVQLAELKSELTTQEWLRVFREAGNMRVLHLHLTGGEPLSRVDLEQMISGARSAGLYTNLITSGIGLSKSRLANLVYSGLDHIQLSFQDSSEEAGDWISGVRVHARKVEVARIIRQEAVAFTINLVVHRQNLDHLEEMIAFFEDLGPDRLEIAHAQYYGWALSNRFALLPTRQQLERSQTIIREAQQRLAGRIRIDWVTADYYGRFPKACMDGWGRKSMLIDPAGRALPCHAAGVIPGLDLANVREHSLEWIWRDSPAFQRFRGDAWMPEPCCRCDRRTTDFGGCRCQAFLLTGNPEATDPVCSLAPQHHVIEDIVRLTNSRTNSPGSLHGSSEGQEHSFWLYRTSPK